MLFHTWGGEQEFAEIDEIASAYPETIVLLAHSGSRRVDAYIDMARRHENVYLDTALSRPERGLIEHLTATAGADKIVFGSDAVFLSLPHQFGKVAGARISDADKERILSRNAEAILAQID